MKKDGEREGKREEGREKERFQDSLVLKSIKIVCMLKLNVIFLEKKKMKTGHIFYIWFFLVALLFTFCSILLKILTFQVVNFITLFLWLKKDQTILYLRGHSNDTGHFFCVEAGVSTVSPNDTWGRQLVNHFNQSKSRHFLSILN